MEQVFIEDYVLSFLKQIKAGADKTPVRLALYGYEEVNEKEKQYIIYGAVCEETGRSLEETGQVFFDEYDFLGYVNVFNNDSESTSQFSIFFDDNKSMQDYLIFYNRRNKTSRMKAIPNDNKEMVNRSHKDGNLNNSKVSGKENSIWNKLKIIFLGGLCFVLATAICTIDDYYKMKSFAWSAEEVIEFIDENE